MHGLSHYKTARHSLEKGKDNYIAIDPTSSNFQNSKLIMFT